MASKTPLLTILNESAKRPPKKKGKAPSIKPSMLGTACPRKRFYSYNKVAEDQGVGLKGGRIMKLGNYVEDMIISTFREDGCLIDYYNPDGSIPMMFGKECREFPVTSKALHINWGFVDGVVIIDGKLWLVEVKSINDRGYCEDLSGGAKEQHYIQALLYLYIFNKNLKNGKYAHIKELEGFEKAEGFRIIYYNKNTSLAKEIPYEKNDKDFKMLCGVIQDTIKQSETGELPGRVEDYCNSCNWNKKCENNETGLDS